MGIKDFVGRLSGRALVDANTQLTELRSELAVQGDNTSLFQERLAELELSLEDQSWLPLSGSSNREFSRRGLQIINDLARIYFLKNPLIRRAVLTQTQYVFGQGVNVRATHPLVNEVVQEFMDHVKNEAELTSQQALMTKETELQCFGNLFFVFFTNRSTGNVRVRTISMSEITDIVTNPEDSKEPWFYRREWITYGVDTRSGSDVSTNQTAYYPDWRYKPSTMPKAIGGVKVETDTPVYHVAVNRLSDMLFGVSEIYSALDWSRAYKEFLENWATITKALARFAWNVEVKGGSAGVSSAKAKLASTLSSGSETNPAPAAGSAFISAGDKINPISTKGVTTSAEDGRYLRLMVSSATGIFEHYLTGDPSTGNLATATAMELPMLVMFRDRQQLWMSILKGILNFVIEQSVKAPSGKIPGKVSRDSYDEEVVILANDKDNEPINRDVTVDFPSILEKNILARVQAVVSAATLDSKSLAGTMELKLVAQLLLEALGLDDIDEIIEGLFPADGEGEVPPEETPEVPPDEVPPLAMPPVAGPEPGEGAVGAEETFVSEVRKLMQRLEEAMRPDDWRKAYATGQAHFGADGKCLSRGECVD